jgi:hypothetical protein
MTVDSGKGPVRQRVTQTEQFIDSDGKSVRFVTGMGWDTYDQLRNPVTLGTIPGGMTMNVPTGCATMGACPNPYPRMGAVFGYSMAAAGLG